MKGKQKFGRDIYNETLYNMCESNIKIVYILKKIVN